MILTLTSTCNCNFLFVTWSSYLQNIFTCYWEAYTLMSAALVFWHASSAFFEVMTYFVYYLPLSLLHSLLLARSIVLSTWCMATIQQSTWKNHDILELQVECIAQHFFAQQDLSSWLLHFCGCAEKDGTKWWVVSKHIFVKNGEIHMPSPFWATHPLPVCFFEWRWRWSKWETKLTPMCLK